MNPFKFGIAVSKTNFVGRGREIKALLSHVKSGQNVLIYGDRKIGKTSLLIKLMHQLSKGWIVLYVDLWGIKTTEDLCVRFLRVLEKIQTFKAKITKWLNLIKSLRPTLSVDEQGSPALSYSMIPRHQEGALEEAMNLLQKIVGNKRTLVIFDEFQEIGLFDKKSDNFELKGKLRSLIQFHKNISYIYCGSIRHIILDMFDNKNEPFYESALKFPLGNIPLADFLPYLKKKFHQFKRRISETIVGSIYNFADAVPNNIQQLCYFIFNASAENQEIDARTVSDGLSQLLDAENPRFLELYHTLPRSQQLVLKILSLNTQTIPLFSQEVVLTYGLKSTQEISDAIKGLINKNILFKDEQATYQFKTIWFKYWVKRFECGLSTSGNV